MFRFILVNDRTLRSDAHCALCCTKIKGSYVREIPHQVLLLQPRLFP
jgi:hypothetical protein